MYVERIEPEQPVPACSSKGFSLVGDDTPGMGWMG